MTTLENDRIFQKIIKNKNLSYDTEKNYTLFMQEFIDINNTSFKDMIQKINDEQYDKIEGNKIIKYNPEYGTIADYFDNYIKHLQSKGNSNSTITFKITALKVIFNYYDIKMPKLPKLEDDSKKWFLLTKEQIKYTMDISDLPYKTIIMLMASTGLRRSDICNLNISDFINATKEYHDCKNIDEFLDYAPQDMIPFFSFYPQKTSKHNIQCKVCCTPEASNMLLLMLRERRNYYMKKCDGLKMKSSDPLFTTRSSKFQNRIKPPSITLTFRTKRVKLTEERKRILDTKLHNNEISQEEYDILSEENPNFTPHALRKYFISTVAENIGNLRVSALMEGHVPPMDLDMNYVKISDDLIKEEYLKLIPSLSFENVEVDLLTSKRKRELEAEIKELKEENREIKENIRNEATKAVEEALSKYQNNI